MWSLDIENPEKNLAHGVFPRDRFLDLRCSPFTPGRFPLFFMNAECRHSSSLMTFVFIVSGSDAVVISQSLSVALQSLWNWLEDKGLLLESRKDSATVLS